MEYRDLRVTIMDRSKIRVVKPAGTSLMPDPEIPMDRLHERTINVLTRYVQEDTMKSREELVVLGSHLFKALFDERACDVLKDELDRVRRKEDSILRLILEFTEAARELAELPWEYIYFPDSAQESGKGFFIAADPESRLILARHVPLHIEEFEPSPEELRILVVVSQPERYPEGQEPLGTVQAGDVIEGISRLAEDSGGGIAVDELRQPTKRKLQERVKAFRPHVVHFLCHGKYEEGTGGSLAFVDEDEKTLAWVSDEDLPDVLLPSPRLVFLHACEGAHSDSYEAFRGVALQLVYSRVAAVVATQYPVENKVAKRFALKFYESLGEGKRIDEAVQDGRRELGMYLKDGSFSSRAFGSPVVFLQTADEIIQIPQRTPEEEPVPVAQPLVATAPDAIRCTQCDKAYVTRSGICGVCGARYLVCSYCGQWTWDSNRVCGSCGESRDRAAGRVGTSAAREAVDAADGSGFADATEPKGGGAQLTVVRTPEPRRGLEGADGR